MRIYKKIAALALSGVMTLGLMAGCSTTETETTPTTAPTVNQATSPTGSEGASEANGLNAPITVISREEGSGTRGAFVEIMGVVDADEVDATVQTAEVVNSTAVVTQTVAGNQAAIGYISMGSLDGTVKAVAVDGVEGTVESEERLLHRLPPLQHLLQGREAYRPGKGLCEVHSERRRPSHPGREVHRRGGKC